MESEPEKKKKLLTIGSSKNAQTQFKTALRNHIDLSAVADNKANIMLSVNALIITVALPLLINIIRDNNQLIIPTIILAVTSVGSMLFAALSTRPRKMSGRTDMDQIQNKNSNLFFFGNFYKMTYEEYAEGMYKVVSDNEILDSSITRDLYYLGKILGEKFEQLRYCYNIFLYGIILTVLSFVFASLL